MDDHLATIQVIQHNSTGVDNALAGDLRAWLRVTGNSNGHCRGFSLILDTF